MSSLPKGLRVMSVDDEMANQMVIGMNLKRFGCECSKFSSAEDALAKLEDLSNSSGFEEFPQVILMDLNLSGMTGVEATAKIRNMYPNQPIKIIIITGQCNQETKDECTAAGCNNFLSKPVTSSSLLNALQECIQA